MCQKIFSIGQNLCDKKLVIQFRSLKTLSLINSNKNCLQDRNIIKKIKITFEFKFVRKKMRTRTKPTYYESEEENFISNNNMNKF